MAILKTDFKHLVGVKANAKHASDGALRELIPGGLLLIQVTSASNPGSVPLIKYGMNYVRCYEDTAHETRRIWGHQWRYVIQGRDLFELKAPFAIRMLQVTDFNYGQGAIRFAYVRDEDADAIERSGRLAPKASG